MSRSRLAIWNYSSAWLFTAVTLVGLVATRYLVFWLGESRWGAFRMMTDWLGYLSLFELGLSGALSPLLARALAANDPAKVRETLATGLRGFLAVTTLTLLLALGLWAGITWLIPVDPLDERDLRIAWGISLISLLPMVVAPFRCLSDARQRGYRINLALTLQSLMIFGLSMAFAKLGWGLTGQAAAMTLAVLPLVVILTCDGLAHSPGVFQTIATRPADPAVAQALISLALPAFLISLSGRVSVLTDSLVVGNILGTTAAARLVLTSKLAVMAQGLLQGIGASSWAALAELHTQGRRDDFNRRLIELTGLVSLLAVTGLAPIIAYNHHFITLWLGAERDAGEAVIVVGAVNALLLGLFSLWFWCFSGTGQIHRMVPVTIVGASVNLVASVGLTHALGIIGPLLGSTLSFVSVSLWYLPWQLQKTFGTSIRAIFQAALLPVALGLPYALLLRLIAHSHKPWGWVGLGAEMGISALAFLFLSAWLIFKPSERTLWIIRITQAFPILRKRTTQ